MGHFLLSITDDKLVLKRSSKAKGGRLQELGWGRSTDAIRLEMHLFLTATYSAKCFNVSLQCGRVLEWAPGIYDNS